MTTNIGTLVASPIVPYDTADTNATHYAIYGVGGLMSVADSAARLAILSSRQDVGMLVYEKDTGKYYRLTATPGSNPANWSEWTATATTFLALTDTPSAYTGSGGYAVTVNSGASALEFTNPTFLWLKDTPSTYSGQANRLLRVNAAANSVEFVLASSIYTAIPTLQQVCNAGYSTTTPLEQHVSGVTYTFAHQIVSTNGGSPLSGTVFDGVFDNCIGSWYGAYDDNYASCVNFMDISNIAPSTYILKYDKTWQGTVDGDPELYMYSTGKIYTKVVDTSTTYAHEINLILPDTPASGSRYGERVYVYTPPVGSVSSSSVYGRSTVVDASCSAFGHKIDTTVRSSGSSSNASGYGIWNTVAGFAKGSVVGIDNVVAFYNTTSVNGAYGFKNNVAASSGNFVGTFYGIKSDMVINGGNNVYANRYITQLVDNAPSGYTYGVSNELYGSGSFTFSQPLYMYYGDWFDDGTISSGAGMHGLYLNNRSTINLTYGYSLNGKWTNAIDLNGATLSGDILSAPYINISKYQYGYNDTVVGPTIPQNVSQISINTSYQGKTTNTIEIYDKGSAACIYAERDRSWAAGDTGDWLAYYYQGRGRGSMSKVFNVEDNGSVKITPVPSTSGYSVTGLMLSLSDGGTYTNRASGISVIGNPLLSANNALVKFTNNATDSLAWDCYNSTGSWGITNNGNIKLHVFGVAPTTATLTTSQAAFYKNSTSGKMYWCVNDSGTIKMVELTA